MWGIGSASPVSWLWTAGGNCKEMALRRVSAGFMEGERPCTDPDRRSSSQLPADQEGSIIFMTTGSYLQLSSGQPREEVFLVSTGLASRQINAIR